MKWQVSYRMAMVRLACVMGLFVPLASPECGKADFTFGEPTNMGPSINSSTYDWGPSISADSLSLYFSSERPGQYSNYGIWVSKRETENHPWGEPVNLGLPINSAYWQEAPRISFDMLTMLFNSDRPGGYGGYDIWMATRPTKDGDWGSPVNLGPMVNSPAHEIYASMSADGLELYFSGWISPFRSGGYGSADIWVARRPTKDDPWGEATNLGPVVNSSSRDARPFISPDGLLLFFDSQRSGGYGSADLYMTRRTSLSEPWGTPINLGPIVNSSDFEESASVSFDGTMLLFDNFTDGDVHQAPIIPIVDFNGDRIVDAEDMCIMVDNWGTDYSLCDIGPMPWGDGVVDVEDLKVLAEHLFEVLPGRRINP